MNIEYLRYSLDSLLYVGQILTPEELLLIRNSLIVIQAENKFRHMFFWGRIQGLEKDYFIAFGYSKDCLKERKFFYSIDCFQWAMMPPVNLDLCRAAVICRTKFCGDPGFYVCVQMDPNFTIDENQIILATEPELVRIKEDDRLACMVHIITEDCAIVPKGALYKMTDHSVIYNPMFHGLNELQANLKTFYNVYRVPKFDKQTNLICRSDYNYTIDFLDSIEDMVPRNVSFVLNLEQNGTLAIIRSCVWPGMTFFHKLNTSRHGFVYFGDAKKNLDLLLML